jgi:hypothetical protein
LLDRQFRNGFRAKRALAARLLTRILIRAAVWIEIAALPVAFIPLTQ